MKPSVIRIYSENNHYQHLDVLKRNRYKRHKNGEFFVEGVRNINEAIANRWTIRALAYTREKPLSRWAEDILARGVAPRLYELPLPLMTKLSDKTDTSELIAVLAIPEDDPARIVLGANPLVVVFDRPSNKGNLGTIIRSCDAFECDGLIMTGHAVDLYDPETVVASMGSFFKLPVVRMASPKELLAWVETVRSTHPALRMIGTSAKAETTVDDCDFTGPTLLFIGNETDGLSWNYKEASNERIRIPIGGSASSLNVACATSVLLYEIGRQRRRARQTP